MIPGQANPANSKPVEAARAERKRIPMSLPIPRLSVPEIPGYHQHWFLGPARCQRALQAGYEFVEEDQTTLNDRDIVGGEGQDMGTRVSLSAGEDLDQQGKPQRLYLMMIREELWQEDQKALEAQSEKMVQALRAGLPANEAGVDNTHRYQGEANRNIFKPVKRSG